MNCLMVGIFAISCSVLMKVSQGLLSIIRKSLFGVSGAL